MNHANVGASGKYTKRPLVVDEIYAQSFFEDGVNDYQVRVVKYNGYPVVNLIKYWKLPDGGDWVPTKSQIGFNAEKWENFLKIINVIDSEFKRILDTTGTHMFTTSSSLLVRMILYICVYSWSKRLNY